jgi:hypothetical protein
MYWLAHRYRNMSTLHTYHIEIEQNLLAAALVPWRNSTSLDTTPGFDPRTVHPVASRLAIYAHYNSRSDVTVYNRGYVHKTSFTHNWSSNTIPSLERLRWVHACNITAHRNTVSWPCGRDSWSCNVSKVGYPVTLRACSVRWRYLAVASKERYIYGLSSSSRLLYTQDVSGCSNKLGTPWCNATGYCYAMRQRMKFQILTP